MKISDLKQRLHKNRPMVTISLRMPADVVEDLSANCTATWVFRLSTANAHIHRTRFAC